MNGRRALGVGSQPEAESGTHCGSSNACGPLIGVVGREQAGEGFELWQIWQIALACNSTELESMVREALGISVPRFSHWLLQSPSASLHAQPCFPGLAPGERNAAASMTQTHGNSFFIS